jgi:uncharacterized protein YbbC (DUF1343 family)
VTAAAALLAVLAAPAVQVGLERVSTEAAHLRGRRVGLLAHAASVTADGRSAVDVLRGAGIPVVRLFAPEHGLRGQAAAGEHVAGGTDEATGLPVVSLYGAETRPRAEDLRDLDAVVVDLQDAGVRFYTYASTLIHLLEAAREGPEVVVLDRPNPLGGELVEGPVRAADVPATLVSTAPGPLVHGLTLGELARHVVAGRGGSGRLTVVRMSGWTRAMRWPDTRREWVAPSPNLRSAEAALAYPGVALLEATNVSEGRGTESPFLLLGAPRLDAAALAAAVGVPGYSLAPVRFTPRASPAAPRPKHEGVECAGLRVGVTDAAHARPYTLGVALLHALRDQPGFGWSGLRPDHLDWLLGTRRVRRMLDVGASVEGILAADADDIEAWRAERKAILLY